MARTRNIKPKFFKNDELADIDAFGRLLYIGLWTIADREGRLEDRPKRIKGELFPYDDIDVGQLLDQLAEHGFIIRYQVDGEKYISIPKFLLHQNPHPKEPASIIPPDKKEIVELHGKQCNDNGKQHVDHEKQFTDHEKQPADPARSLILDPRSLILDQDLNKAAAANIIQPIVTPTPQEEPKPAADAAQLNNSCSKVKTPLDVLDDLACEVLGRVCTSPLETQAMQKMLEVTGGDFDLIRRKVREINANYKPKYPGDRIKSFSYFLSGVLEEVALQKARAAPIPSTKPRGYTDAERAEFEEQSKKLMAILAAGPPPEYRQSKGG